MEILETMSAFGMHRHLLFESSKQPFSKEEQALVIIEEVCKHFNVDRDAVMGRGRLREYVYPRQYAMWMIWNKTKMSKSAIGELMNRNHATVIHSIRAVDLRLDPKFGVKGEEEKIETLRTKLKYSYCFMNN